MKINKGHLTLLVTLLWLNIPLAEVKANAVEGNNNTLDCPEPALSRLKRHLVAPGETIESIASLYNLIPATLLGMNPSIRQGEVRAGSEIIIPPFNGVAVEVPANQTWRDVAAAYKVRDALVYEANGCQEDPKIVFLPGVNWSPVGSDNFIENSTLSGYPLPTVAPVALGYGWLLHPGTRKVFFHSGLDLLANPGTPVLAAGDGIVAFAGERGNYGYLVVVNHQEGQQTRYAHLDSMTVTTGQPVRQGQQLGTVGGTGSPDIETSHLHFEVRYNSELGWVAEDPKSYLRQMVGTVENPPQTSNNPNPSPLVVPETGQQPAFNLPATLPPPLPETGGTGDRNKPAIIPVPPGTGRIVQPNQPVTIPVPPPGSVQ
ncbi:MAG TPA: M23 family metallopeptidase [Phormidium sp.]